MNDPIAQAFRITDYFSGSISPIQIVLTILVAFLIGGFIYLIYKKTFSGVMYSRSFNLSLVMLTMVTSLVLLLINNNLTMSLGMVGALSIVRFRTAVKDPIDTVFMFWAIAEGMALGAKFFDVALIGMLVIGAVMVIITSFRRRSNLPYLLVLHYHEGASQAVRSLVRQLPKHKLKSKVVRQEDVELTLEIRLQENETAIAEKFMRIGGVYDATLLSHEGDMIS